MDFRFRLLSLLPECEQKTKREAVYCILLKYGLMMHKASCPGLKVSLKKIVKQQPDNKIYRPSLWRYEKYAIFAPSKKIFNNMAKKKDKTEDNIIAVEDALSKSEVFIEKNQQLLTIVIGTIIVLILLFFGARRFYIEPREASAQEMVFKAQQYFAQDSLRLALEGDGNYPGFLEIISDYRWTKTARLSNYYAGIIFLKQGEYEDAVRHLKRFRSRDILVQNKAHAAIGDAHLGLGNPSKAASYYMKAAKSNVNDFTTPIYLMKAAQTYESMGQWKKALNIYERIQREHFQTQEGRDIEKYIARAKANM
jgi:tetratricopeptide (TPR) repeat protein